MSVLSPSRYNVLVEAYFSVSAYFSRCFSMELFHASFAVVVAVVVLDQHVFSASSTLFFYLMLKKNPAQSLELTNRRIELTRLGC